MRTSCWCCLLLPTFLAYPAAVLAADNPAAGPRVEVKVVKYAELGEEVKKHKGQVVVVDFWATFCPPCIRELPRLVRMHEQYGNKGFAAISVSIDEDAQKPEVQEKILKILRPRNAHFTNLILDEQAVLWQEKLGFAAVPCVIVFNREGRWVKKFKDDEANYDEVEKLVLELLGK